MKDTLKLSLLHQLETRSTLWREYYKVITTLHHNRGTLQTSLTPPPPPIFLSSSLSLPYSPPPPSLSLFPFSSSLFFPFPPSSPLFPSSSSLLLVPLLPSSAPPLSATLSYLNVLYILLLLLFHIHVLFASYISNLTRLLEIIIVPYRRLGTKLV